jgi:hypothetical protein
VRSARHLAAAPAGAPLLAPADPGSADARGVGGFRQCWCNAGPGCLASSCCCSYLVLRLLQEHGERDHPLKDAACILVPRSLPGRAHFEQHSKLLLGHRLQVCQGVGPYRRDPWETQVTHGCLAWSLLALNRQKHGVICSRSWVIPSLSFWACTSMQTVRCDAGLCSLMILN